MSISGQKRAEQHRTFRHLELLLDLTAAISQAKNSGEIYRAAAQGLVHSLSADRAAILIFDPDDVLLFKESVGLSEQYRTAVEGQTPWRRGAVDVQPIVVSDVQQDLSLSAHRQVFAKEGIRAVAYIPLLANGELIGKLALYRNAPHEFQKEEIRVLQAISTQVAGAWARQHVAGELRDSQQRLLFAQGSAHAGVWDSDLKFSALFEASPDAMVVTKQDGEIVLLNSQVEKLFGYRPDELLGQKVELLMPKHYRGRHRGHRKDYFTQPVKRPMGSRRELRGRRKDGTEFSVEIDLSPLNAGDGLLVSAAIRDVTERKRMDEALRESEERFRRVFEEGPLGLALVGKDFRFVNVNTALCKLTEYSEAALLQMTFADITHPDDLPADVELAERLFKGEIPFYTMRKRYVKRSGEIVWINLTGSLVHNSEGEPLYALAMIEDITERKRAEDALRESQRHLDTIYNTVEDIIFHLANEPEGQFRIVSVNAAFLRVTGLGQKEVIGKTVNEVIPEPSLTMVLEKYRQAIEENTVVHWKETSNYPAGRRTGEVSVAPVLDNTGTCTHLVGSVHDITDITRADEIGAQLASDLAASHNEIRALAASLMRAQEDERRRISRELHDHICHQLVSLAVDISKLTAGPQPSPKNARAQLKAIRARVVQASQEAHDIAYQMHTSIIDDLGLSASLKDLCSQFYGRHPDIAVEFEDSGLQAPIPGEVASCLYRVAEEGLENISKHSRAKSVSVRLGFKKGSVVLKIRDDGAGFDPKAVKGHGGLGLISMKERAHLVNGKLTITAQPGQGTQVSLEVPVPAQHL